MQFSFFDEWKNRLASKYAAVVCILLAVLNKSIIAWQFSSLSGDKGLYLLFAKSLLETGRLAEPVSLIENGSTAYLYSPAIHSPLYSLLAAPLLWLTNSFFYTQFLLSVAGWLLFYTGLYHLTIFIFRHRWLASSFVLCSGFFLYPHELSSTPKDTIAVGLTFWNIVLMYRFLQQPRLTTTLLLAIVVCSLTLIKLLYIPLAAVLLFLLFVFLLMERKRSHAVQAILLIVTIVTIGWLVRQFIFEPAHQLAIGTNLRLPDDGAFDKSGFFLSNLRYMFPFVSSSLINTHLWAVQLEKMTSFSFSQITFFFLVIDAVLFVGLIAVSLWFSRQIIANRVLFFLIVASVTMVGIIIFLSVTEQKDSNKSIYGMWTFAMDARSFLAPMLTLQIALFLFCFGMRNYRVFRRMLLFVFLFECGHGLYFTVKQIVGSSTEDLSESNDATQIIKATIAGQQKSQAATALVTSDVFLRRYVRVHNLPVYSFSNQPPQLSWMKKGTRFLVATLPDDSLFLQKFPAGSLFLLDTVPPFIMHRFDVR